MLYVVFGYNKLVPNLFSSADPLVDPGISYQSETIKRYNNKNRGAFLRRICEPEPSACFQCQVPCVPDCLPPPDCAYDFIKLFCELYPAITGIMGGCNFPEPCQNLLCIDIPPNYNCLVSIPEYLLRFTEFSYCAYLEWIDSKQVRNALGAKIDNRIRYLKTF